MRLVTYFIFGILSTFEIQQEFCFAERILFFNGFASHSHFVAFEPLVNKLAERTNSVDGKKIHNVTFLTPMTPESIHPDVTYYCPKDVAIAQSGLNTLGSDGLLLRLQNRYNDLFMTTAIGWEGNMVICEAFFGSSEFRQWMEVTTFDLVIIDSWTRECFMPIAHKWGAKFILLSPPTILYYDHDSFSIVTESSWQFTFSTSWNFIPDSIMYEYESIKWHLWRQFIYLPRYDALIQKSLNDPTIPTVAELEKRAAIYFLNTYFVSDIARSLPPWVVQVGGMHCREAQGIKDKKIRDAVEDPKFDGFVYISFGSFLQISALPPQYLNIFFQVIKSFPRLKFLWRWDGINPVPESVPSNVFIMKWFPQQDLLGHPKCKGFISQGGLMSFQQAVFHGVPLLVIPVWGDQTLNSKLVVKWNIGLSLEFLDMTIESFKSAVNELVYNPRYTETSKQISKLYKDRPMSAVDTAVYWTEYVLRNDNFTHLKSPGLVLDLPWWQRRLIHIYGGVFIMLAIVLKLLMLLGGFFFTFVRNLMFSSQKKSNSNKTKYGSEQLRRKKAT